MVPILVIPYVQTVNILPLQIIVVYFVHLIAKHVQDHLPHALLVVFLLLGIIYSYKIIFANQTVRLAYTEILGL